MNLRNWEMLVHFNCVKLFLKNVENVGTENWMAKGLGVAVGLGNHLPSGKCKTKIEIPSLLDCTGI